MIRILVIDGSPTQRTLLSALFSRDPSFVVVGSAHDAEDGLRQIQYHSPDIVTVGHQLPLSDGFSITSRIMESRALPIVVVAANTNPSEVSAGFDAVKAGALAVVQSPLGNGDPSDHAAIHELLSTVRVMSEVKVVRRWARPQTARLPRTDPRPHAAAPLVAIGASTGGPLALVTLLGGLPRDFAAPVVVVQHMATGFLRGFVDWLAPSSALPLHIATEGERLQAGHIYLAPDALQMRITRTHCVALDDAPPENGLRPSVSYLFRSVAHTYGADAVGVLLTGMGRDGAAELKLMRDAGAVTFAQDKESSIVHGMPGEAIKLQAATHVLPPAAIADALTRLVSTRLLGRSD